MVNFVTQKKDKRSQRIIKKVTVFQWLSCFPYCHACGVPVLRRRDINRKYTLWLSEEPPFHPYAFLVSLERSKVSLHIFQKGRREQKHNDVIASWEFHYLKQVNCAGKHKRKISQHSSKKSLRNQTLMWRLTPKWLAWKMSFMQGCVATLTCARTHTHTHTHTHTENICTNRRQ